MLVCAPVSAHDPASSRQPRSRRPHALDKRHGLVHVEQVCTDEQRAGGFDVDVRIVEAGQRELAAQVEHPGVWTGQRADLPVAADREDAVSANRQRLCPRLLRVERVDATVDQDQIGRRTGCGRRRSLRASGRSGHPQGQSSQDRPRGDQTEGEAEPVTPAGRKRSCWPCMGRQYSGGSVAWGQGSTISSGACDRARAHASRIRYGRSAQRRPARDHAARCLRSATRSTMSPTCLTLSSQVSVFIASERRRRAAGESARSARSTAS